MGVGTRMRTDEIRIVVQPSQRGATPALVDWLEKEFNEDGELLRGAVHRVRREEQEPTLGIIEDLLIRLGVSVGVQVAGYLVRFLASRLSSQSDTGLIAEVRCGEKRIRISASGMTPEQLRDFEAQVREWIQPPPHEN